MAAYPDAKIILNIRDVEGWAKSIDGSFYTIVNWKRWSLLELIDLVRQCNSFSFAQAPHHADAFSEANGASLHADTENHSCMLDRRRLA